MGDNNRFKAFADLIKKHIPTSKAIVDVAGGQGFLQQALRKRGFQNVTTYDKRKKHVNKNSGKQVFLYFDYKTAPLFDAVVAMHPDEGTDHALMYSVKYKASALICPCCIKPHAIAFHKSSFMEWKIHLQKIAEKAGADVFWTTLPITGRKDVLIVKW